MRTLQIAHGHPLYGAGGTELTALGLHRRALAAGEDSWFLGATDAAERPANAGTNLIGISPDGRESVLWVPGFDRFRLHQPDSFGALRELSEYLMALRPAVVRVHHVLNLGLEAIAVARAALPGARIVLTLHDYYLICAAHGQLYRHHDERRCDGPSLPRCLKCVPGTTQNDFALRRADIDHAVSLVDEITAPSAFLRAMVARHAPWGARVRIEENLPAGPAERAPPPPARRPGDPVTFGFFGNLTRLKGVPELMAAARLLAARGKGPFRLHVHGAEPFADERVAAALAAAREALGPRLLLAGAYEPDDLPRLMAPVHAVVFPSVWWENAPLTVLEARHHARPVIAFPHGGAPELLTRHGGGIVAERSDPEALADAMERVMEGGVGGQATNACQALA